MLARRRADPDHGRDEEEHEADDHADRGDRDGHDRDREADGVEDRQPARRRHVDLLADGRGGADSVGVLHHEV